MYDVTQLPLEDRQTTSTQFDMAKRKNRLTFEESMEQLRSIVRELEEGNLSLSDSLKKYESGIGHLQQCYEDLAMAERKIQQLVRVDQDGKLITQPFDDKASNPVDTSGETAGKGYSGQKSAVKKDTDIPPNVAKSLATEVSSEPFLFAAGSDSDDEEDEENDEFDDDYVENDESGEYGDSR